MKIPELIFLKGDILVAAAVKSSHIIYLSLQVQFKYVYKHSSVNSHTFAGFSISKGKSFSVFITVNNNC